MPHSCVTKIVAKICQCGDALHYACVSATRMRACNKSRLLLFQRKNVPPTQQPATKKLSRNTNKNKSNTCTYEKEQANKNKLTEDCRKYAETVGCQRCPLQLAPSPRLATHLQAECWNVSFAYFSCNVALLRRRIVFECADDDAHECAHAQKMLLKCKLNYTRTKRMQCQNPQWQAHTKRQTDGRCDCDE